jgi:signal transduction histidine kinase
MTESHEHPGPPWGGGRWAEGRGPWRSGGPARRVRRGAFAVLVVVVLVIAVLSSLVASLVAGNQPDLWIFVVVTALVLVAVIASARWLWRYTRAIGALMDAADRVAGGDYEIRVDPSASGQLRRLGTGFNEMAERLETNERRRRELLADMAHELRTPLQVIRGSVEGMLDGLYAPDPERLHMMLDETALMARLLDDLRTLSMAEEGVLPLHRETVDARTLAEDALRSFASIAADAGVTLSLDAPDRAPIDADPVRLAEVLQNLLSNAIRHTPSGGRVLVEIAVESGDLRFAVTDTGPGIPAELLPHVFDRFVRSADTGGTGLGLAIAKRLVEAHGGTIQATEPTGGGTSIAFTIPTG